MLESLQALWEESAKKKRLVMQDQIEQALGLATQFDTTPGNQSSTSGLGCIQVYKRIKATTQALHMIAWRETKASYRGPAFLVDI